MPIKGVSDVRRFTRLGKIRLGERKKSQKGTEYPSKIDFFKIDPYDDGVRERVLEIFGEKPRKISIAFPDNDPERVFPQYYECWSASALLCKGTGETATRNDKGEYTDVECPGPETCPFALDHGVTYGGERITGCKRVARLQVVLPDLDSFGVFQLDTGSFNSIINVNSAIDLIQKVTGGRIAWIPLTMVLKAQEVTIPKTGKRTTIYAVDILLPVGLREVATLKPLLTYANERKIEALEAPHDDRPDDLLPGGIALPASGMATAEVVDEETGEILDGDTDGGVAVEDEPATDEPAQQDIGDNDEVFSAFEAAHVSDAKRNALLASAREQGWSPQRLISMIKANGGRSGGQNGNQKQAKPATAAPGNGTQAANTLF